MDNTNLINIIDKFLDEYNELQKTCERCRLLKELYNELLTYLDNDYGTLNDNKTMIALLINEIYKDDMYISEFYATLYSMGKDKESIQRFKRLRKRIENDSKENEQKLADLNIRLFRNRYIPASAKRVKICLTHNIPINQNKYDIPNIKRILNYYEASGAISNKEELLLINVIETHNRKMTSKTTNNKEESEYVEALYNEIPNIVNSGFQEHDQIEVNDERKPVLDKMVKEILNYIDYLDKDDIEENIKRYSYNLETNEYSYIIVSILNTYLDDLITYYQLLIDREVYINREERTDVIKSYYGLLNKYLTIMKHYNEINDFKPDNEEDNIEEKPEASDENNELIFSHSDNSDKVKIITDMKDVPHEYYQTVWELIDSFIQNKLSKKEIKSLKNNGKLTQFIELKYDQVRIVLKHINDNIYCVMGVAVKKSDNDMTMYNKLANRRIPDISTSEKLTRELELSEYVKKEIEKIVNEKGRKGTR